MDTKHEINSYSLHPSSARNLSHSTKSKPVMEGMTPRWLLDFLPWVSVEAGVYRVNKRKNYNMIPQTDDYSDETEDIRTLYNIPPFKYMEPSKVNSIKRYLSTEHYDAGNTVMHAGREGDKLYVVTKGKVEVSTRGLRGEKINIGILTDGEHSNIDAFVKDSDRVISMKAITPTELYYLDRDDFEEWIRYIEDHVTDHYKEAYNAWEKEKMDSNEHGEKSIDVYSGKIGEFDLPLTYPDYHENPKEYPLNLVQTILRMNTQVTDIFNYPIDQMEEQMRLTIEAMKERQEWEIINNKEFGLLNLVVPKMKVQSREGVPTPDAMDELLSRVWKKPAFFLAHPKAIAAFGRECTRRGVPPKTINMYGSPFMTWRGVPIVPCDKLLINGKKHHHSSGTTNILLMRVGEEEQGVIGLHQPGIPDEKYMPSLSVKYGGIDHTGIASYILRLYYSAAVLADDALGVLEDVEVGYYHDYE